MDNPVVLVEKPAHKEVEEIVEDREKRNSNSL